MSKGSHLPRKGILFWFGHNTLIFSLHYQPPEWLFYLPRILLSWQELVRQVQIPTLLSMTAMTLFNVSFFMVFPLLTTALSTPPDIWC